MISNNRLRPPILAAAGLAIALTTVMIIYIARSGASSSVQLTQAAALDQRIRLVFAKSQAGNPSDDLCRLVSLITSQANPVESMAMDSSFRNDAAELLDVVLRGAIPACKLSNYREFDSSVDVFVYDNCKFSYTDLSQTVRAIFRLGELAQLPTPSVEDELTANCARFLMLLGLSVPPTEPRVGIHTVLKYDSYFLAMHLADALHLRGRIMGTPDNIDAELVHAIRQHRIAALLQYKRAYDAHHD